MAKKKQSPKLASPEKIDAFEHVETDSQSSFPIVGIGASAGGLEALREFLKNLPADTGMGFVIVTHQHPGHESLLPEILGRQTSMPVVEATDGIEVEPNHVYVSAPEGYMAILNHVLHQMEPEPSHAIKLPIDYFLRSLADDLKEKAICIILSGTGTDGTIGLRAVKAASGMAMAEDPQAAKYSGMPSSAIATGLVDYVLPASQMPKQIVGYTSRSYVQATSKSSSESSIPVETMQKIFVLLRNRTGNNFSGYKLNTLRRRIERRMNVHELQSADAYVRYLQENPHEIDALFKELLISVTNFFRDPEAWEALAAPLKELIQSRPEKYVLRGWVPGCATGEEVYSLAILLRECMEQVKRHPNVQIFGTDLDMQAISTARVGCYPEGIAGDVAENRLKRYFTQEDNTYRIRSEIREWTIFAVQNLISDPPFSKLDIIFCRNLLIYFNADLQRKLLPLFHYALKPGGLLFLGSSETIGIFGELFETIDKRWKIFRRIESRPKPVKFPPIPEELHSQSAMFGEPTGSSKGRLSATVPSILDRILLSRFAPPCVIVNDNGDIIYIHGRTGAYLEPAQGQPRANILEMAREGLEIELAAAIRECVKSGQHVDRKGLLVRTDGYYNVIDLQVSRLESPEPVNGLLLVAFLPATSRLNNSLANSDTTIEIRVERKHIQQLTEELQSLKENHRTTLEELETSIEELKSTNEELQSANEELQSTNEELETSKEEMQSLNEELMMVNAELELKIDDLSQANDDMQNLFNSTDIATLFLDSELQIKRFTKQARDLIMLRPTDVGRPISDLASNLNDYQTLEEDCRRVLQTCQSHETEVRKKDGLWYLMRIVPYRTIENVIDGLAITFVNISRLKKAEEAAALRQFFENIVDTIHQPLLVLDENYQIVSANKSFFDTFHLRPQQTLDFNITEVSNGVWNNAKFRNVLKEILPGNKVIENFEIEYDFPGIGVRTFLVNARRLIREEGQPDRILIALDDVSDETKS